MLSGRVTASGYARDAGKNWRRCLTCGSIVGQADSRRTYLFRCGYEQVHEWRSWSLRLRLSLYVRCMTGAQHLHVACVCFWIHLLSRMSATVWSPLLRCDAMERSVESAKVLSEVCDGSRKRPAIRCSSTILVEQVTTSASNYGSENSVHRKLRVFRRCAQLLEWKR